MYQTNDSGYSGGNGGSYSSSQLESIVAQYSIAPAQQQPIYLGNNTSIYRSSAKAVVDEQPFVFLNPKRPETPFIGAAFEVKEAVKQAFLLTTGEQLPEDLTMTVAPREELISKELSFMKQSVVGLSLHTTREIFVVAGELAPVMLAIGHELGHIMGKPARTAQEEEAKAFAFEAAWARAIFENDVAGLSSSINAAAFSPAKNGLHDVAFNFVKNNDNEPLQLFNSLSKGEITAEQVFEGTALQPQTTTAITYSLPKTNKTRIYAGYQNKSRVMNLPPPHNFFWGDLGRGIYGMYVPMTTVETLNETLLRKDIEQMHRTQGHEYSLHHVMGLPDGYVVEALEEAMFWIGEEDDKYRPRTK